MVLRHLRVVVIALERLEHMCCKPSPQKDSFLERKKAVLVYFVSFSLSPKYHSLQITFIARLSREQFRVDFKSRVKVGHNLF